MQKLTMQKLIMLPFSEGQGFPVIDASVLVRS
jgi:hypothetical protein